MPTGLRSHRLWVIGLVAAVTLTFPTALLVAAAQPASAANAVIFTLAGNGIAGYSGDGGIATSAELNSPDGVATDTSGNVYITDDSNCRIRKVDPSRTITTFAGNGTCGYAGDGGAAPSAELNGPDGIAVDAAGNVFITEWTNCRVRKVNTAGTISTFAGNGTCGYLGDGGAATSAELNNPFGVAIDKSGAVYIADDPNCRVRKVNTAGTISTFAGNGTCGYTGDGGTATSAELSRPSGVAVDSAGNLYVADYANNSVRQVTPAGGITTYAGTGLGGYSGDGGAATSAELNLPEGLATDRNGDLYIADSSNCLIREVSTTGIISTYAGNPSPGIGGPCNYSGDGGSAFSADLSYPEDVAIDSVGNVIIADTVNNRIRGIVGEQSDTTASTPWAIALTASAPEASSGQVIELTATANQSVSGTTVQIDIADNTVGGLVATCLVGQTCTSSVLQTVPAGQHVVTHAYTAYVDNRTLGPPPSHVVASSNQFPLSWVA